MLWLQYQHTTLGVNQLQAHTDACYSSSDLLGHKLPCFCISICFVGMRKHYILHSYYHYNDSTLEIYNIPGSAQQVIILKLLIVQMSQNTSLSWPGVRYSALSGTEV